MSRICIVRHAYFPDDPRDRKQAYALIEAGHEVDVLCLRRAGQSASETVNGVQVTRVALSHKRAGIVRYFSEYVYSFLLFSMVLFGRCFGRRYDCIQVSTMPDFLVFTAAIPKLIGSKVLIDLHEPTPELWETKYGPRHRVLYHLQAGVEKAAIGFSDRCITVTRTLLERFSERGADVDKFTVIPNVCEEAFDKALNEQTSVSGANTGNGKFELVTHGLIEKRYGHELVIRAIKGLSAKYSDILYTIVGDGEYCDFLKSLVNELDCSAQVRFTGFISFDAMIEHLKRADVGVIAMERSPYSELIDTNKMYEYIALHKPVIISRLPALEANFSDDSLEFFEPGDIDGLAKCIERLHNNGKRQNELVDEAYRIYESVQWRKSKKTYVKVIEEMI
jgi:glycosyltransferase involved in cell wall biosynthesis